MSTFSDAVTLPTTSPRTITDFANTAALDLAVRTNGEDVLAKLDLAFDLAFDGQVLAAVQLAFDDNRFTDVHDVPHWLASGRDGLAGASTTGACAAGTPAVGGVAGVVGPCGARTPSSRFHIRVSSRRPPATGA